ncbi:MAG: type IV pilus assembly protein PilM [Thermoguttaceae bacterium]
MARSDGVWGIDIGNASLKALRCRSDSGSSKQIVADAFDYIEYPKLLTQTGADPAELINDALKQFLSRNSVRGDRVAISVAGQNGLARFIKLPPVESSKIPAIVRYEARQQIPFDLNDVVWDYQRMSGGSEEEGFALETEIGLFAMKRDQVFRALEPFRTAGIEVDLVQLTPLALYNFLFFDQLHDLPSLEEYDPDAPPPSTVILSMGTDATDLVVTNGFRVWQRSIPIGGNHFTKALTKELKLTFAKAEHLKRNATTAEDPKAVFQAMRPVFNDLLTEIQRSIGYFTSIDRSAKIERMVTLGNAMKLPGLRRYLAQNLGFDVVRVESFQGLGGPEVVSAPAFKENLLCFGVSYGLALQGLSRGALRTNLLPQELVQERMIRAKKPWAVGAIAMLLLGMSISFVSFSRALNTTDPKAFESAEQRAKQVDESSKNLQQEQQSAEGEFDSTDQIGKNLVGNVEGRILWLEMLQGLNNCLPKDPEGKRPKEIELRNEIHITNLECQKYDKLEEWFEKMKQANWYEVPPDPNAPAKAARPAPAPTAAGDPSAPVDPNAQGDPNAPAPGQEGPSGTGWIIQLTGYHDHNGDKAGANYGAQYLRNTLLTNLFHGKVFLPTGESGKGEWVTNKELGLTCPVLLDPGRVQAVRIKDPDAEARAMSGAASGMPGQNGMGMGSGPSMGAGMGNDPNANMITVHRFNFVVQICWQPTPPSERHKRKEAAAAAANPDQSQAVAPQ